MFEGFRNAWKLPDLRKKIIYTILMLLVYRVGCYVPIPGVDIEAMRNMVSGTSLLGFLDTFSGGALSNLTVFALGIIPYINASIIMNLLTVALPPLERLAKEADGSRKIAAITRYVGVALGLIMALSIVLSNKNVITGGALSFITVILCLTAGTALIMWIGEQINEKGIGNGISLLIFTSIVARFPTTLAALIQNTALGTIKVWMLLLTILGILIIITAITGVDMSERRIPVQYAKRVVGRKMYGGQSTYIPVKLNQSGVMPLIFAVTFLQFPGMIAEFFPKSAFYASYNGWVSSINWSYILVYAALIFAFTFFYAQIAFNPIDVSKNMQQNGGFILGIRPGRPTSEYLGRVSSRITLFGAIFLAVIAAVPMIFSAITGISGAIGATSILIIVSVALETDKQIESQLMMRHYKGFLK